jgi:hypothetical protein
MLSICDDYWKRWRVEYNQNKCGIIVSNERNTLKSLRQWKIGAQTIEKVEDYMHLGVSCNDFMSTKKSIQDGCIKLRGTFREWSVANMHTERH